MASFNPTTAVTFRTSDGELVKVAVEMARMSTVVKNFFNGDVDDPESENAVFPLPNVSRSSLGSIVDACVVRLALRSKKEAVAKEWQDFEAEFTSHQSDETIVELVKAADYLEINELLDFMWPSFRKRFGIGIDKDVDFVYTAEAEAIVLRRAALARKRYPGLRIKATYGGSSEPNPTKMAIFKTSDGELVKLPIAIAKMFGIVEAFFDGNLDDTELENTVFPLPKVCSSALSIIVHACIECLALRSKDEAVEKERQEFEAEFFGQHCDEAVIELIKAVDYMDIQELLKFMWPSFRKRFGLGDDKDVDFVYTAEAEALLLRRAASTSIGASSWGYQDIMVM